MSTWMVSASAMVLLQRLRLLDRRVDRADHVEGLFGQRVELAADDALEAADGVLERDDLAILAREHLRNVERLRQEVTHFTGAIHDLLVLFRELVHTQDRDDVLQLLVALEHGLHTAGG